MTTNETLIVVAAYDDSFAHNLPTLKGGPLLVVDTSAGGHPSGAFVRAYRENPGYHSYLFLQDSLEGTVDDVVAPFREDGAPVVAWGVFGLFYDDHDQQKWVESQYPPPYPAQGFFGPIFYASKDAMRTLDERDLFPRTPQNRHQAQGTERAWCVAFHTAGVPWSWLGHWDNGRMASGEYPVFKKTFAGRP